MVRAPLERLESMSGHIRRLGLALAAGLVSITAAPAPAIANDRAFFDRIEGQWSGPGRIIAGKYKGTKFSCDLRGSTTAAKPGMALDGKCRVGVFTQQISAVVEQDGRSYKGRFMDGADGKGLDVISGNVADDRVTVAMERAELKGAMVARVKPNGRLGVTVSVRVGDELVPVVGIDLSRSVDQRATGSLGR